ncbi:MAG: [LysW]-lysine hydrolase [Chloroflexota bacterium]|nr:[LysW]-lysine hydrolase [Chloroflexota bacterium]
MDEVVFLEELLRIPSPSGEEDVVAEYLVEQMTTLGFQAHRDEAGNAIGIVGNPEAGREIVLLGHMDTVPGFIPVHRRGNLLYGRGAVDAKGPLAAFVLAAAQAATWLNDAQVVVIGAVEEEAHGKGAHHLARTMQPPYCAIIGEPSHWEGITLGYKGQLCVNYRRVQPGGHSAGERPGPAEKSVAFWNRLMNYSEEFNRGRSGHFDTLDPALRDFHTFSDGLDDGVEMSIVVRLPPGIEAEDLEQRMQTWCNGARLSFPGSDPPFRSEKNTPPVRALLRAIRTEGGRPRFKLKTGTSDMNVVGPTWGCPIVAYGPGDSSLDHTPDEHIDVQEFKRGINVLARALKLLNG